ncbi:uncharacterized protein LOC108324578 [Vigna angularis]|uniref:uncharacterized protein LOC108324578 n=1 Tax=Phaseolus angularis TaxID=3914 RepID=UPI0022B4CD24|nr:uncharacterized protein LOC108324578 [Vigna angularis]
MQSVGASSEAHGCHMKKLQPLSRHEEEAAGPAEAAVHGWLEERSKVLHGDGGAAGSEKQEKNWRKHGRFGVPKAIISDQGTHFCNQLIATLLSRYGVKHKVSTPYHPQINGQVEVFNIEVKKLLQKLVQPNRKNWSELLDEALWAQRTAYRTPLGMSPFRIVFGKSCHLLVEIEHKAFWAVKRCNLEYNEAGKQRKLQLQELDEIRLEAYENSRFYKEKVKRFHGMNISRKEFSIRQKVLLYNSKMKLIAGKLRSKWEGPYIIVKIFPNGAVEIRKPEADKSFTVNGHQLKIFQEKQPLENEKSTLQFNDPVLENLP